MTLRLKNAPFPDGNLPGYDEAIMVAMWIIFPLAALHLFFWYRRRKLLQFQLCLDLLLAAVLGPAIFVGGQLDPVRCLARNDPFQSWDWAERTQFQPTQSDVVVQFHPWWEEARRQLRRGRLPRIAPNIGAGMPLLANGQLGLAAPMMLPVWVLGPDRGTTVMALWKLELAGLGAFLLLWRGWRLGWHAAAVGGLSFAGSTYLVAWLLVPLSWIAAMLPWAWWAILVATRLRAGWRTPLLVGLGFGWLLGAGLHPETAVVVVGSALFAGVVMRPRRWPRVLLISAVALPIAVVLAWPTLVAIRSSGRYESLQEERPNTRSLPSEVRVAAAQQLVVPFAHGHPGRDDWRGPYPHAPAALGVAGAAFALLLVGRYRRRHQIFARATLMTLTATSILVYRLPLLDWLLVRLPPLDRMTLPRFGVLIPFSLALLAALAVEAVRAGRARTWGWRLVPVALFVVVALSARVWTLTPASVACIAVSGILATIAAVTVVRLPGLVVLAVACECSVLAFGINPVAMGSDLLPTPPVINRLQQLHASEGGRVMGFRGMLPPNLASRYGLPDLRASDPVRPRSFVRMMAQLGETRPEVGDALTIAPAALCGAWSVRWLIAHSGVQPPGWEAEWRDHDASIWRNPQWLPEIRLLGSILAVTDTDLGWELLANDGVDLSTTAVLPSPAPPVAATSMQLEILEDRPDSLAVQVVSDGPCLLVVARPWTPAWQARVDNESRPVLRANLAALGVQIPAGTHLVRLFYSAWIPSFPVSGVSPKP